MAIFVKESKFKKNVDDKLEANRYVLLIFLRRDPLFKYKFYQVKSQIFKSTPKVTFIAR